MDIQPAQQSISNDQELAKVLAGVTQGGGPAGLQFEETGTTMPSPSVGQGRSVPVAANTPTGTAPANDGVAQQPVPVSEPAPQPASPAPQATPAVSAVSSRSSGGNIQVGSGDGSLDTIKSQALTALRPLVGKLNVSPEEKFDTYLLLLRSTDDKALIAPAHAAALEINDETRKAQALLDIIKEIDYLSNPRQ